MLGKNLFQSQETFRNDVLTQMRDEGFAPVIDMDPVFKWSWLKDDLYEFTYTIQGVYVGKDKSWQTEGVSNGKRIPSTPKDK
jgi:hypothetical protein